MQKKIRVLITLTIIILLLLVSIGYYFSSEIIAFKVRSLDENKTNLKVSGFGDFGLPTPESLRFQNGGISLRGWFFKNPLKKKCGVLLLHGHTGTRYAVLKYAPLFWKRGCSIFAYDARHHGESGGLYGTYGYNEKIDLDRAMEYFSEVSAIPETNIGILGESYGAATALQFAEGKSEIAFVIADSPYKDMRSIIEKRAVDLYSPVVLIVSPIALSIAELRADFIVDKVSPWNSAKKITIPVLLVHSKADEFTPFSHSEEIFSVLQSEKKQLALTDWNAPHGKSINTNFGEYEKLILEFLKEIPNF
ncbi:alpha/beta hydrolase [Leptospira sp. 96542]|nr:alpha/beta hydrolase [Leptospira sp. 96542]